MKTRHTTRFAIFCFVSLMAVTLAAQAQEAGQPKARGSAAKYADSVPLRL
jgi:hypothetical protein